MKEEKKKNFFVKFAEIIKWSLFKKKDDNSTPSSSRIFSYIMMVIIFLFGLTCISIELVNAIQTWQENKTYTIPWEHITILGMWLAHQLTLLGIYKRAEVKIPDLSQTPEKKAPENNKGTEGSEEVSN